MRPDLTGKGLGAELMRTGMDMARSRYEHQEFIVRVWELNSRAVRTYERAGFRVVKREKEDFDGMPFTFLTMTREG